MPAVLHRVQRLRRQLREGHERLAVRRADQLALHEVEVRDGQARQLVGVVQYLLPQDAARLADGKAAHIGLARGVGPAAVGGHIRVLRRDDVNAPEGDAHSVGGHLCVNSVAALAYLSLTSLHLDGAVLVEHHAAGAALQRDGPDAGVVPVERHAHAPADIPRLRL